MISKISEEELGFVGESNQDLSARDVDRATKQVISLEERLKEAELNRYNQDTQHRGNLSVWAGALVSFWLVSVLLILVGNNSSYKLHDSVLITLLGTTTLNVLGLMVIVLSDLFNKSKNKS